MSSSDLSELPPISRRRRKRRSYSLLILAAGIFLFGVAAGTLYLVLRPVTLRIAVGPAGSDDQKLIQALAQTFARERSPVRLSLITTEGATESIALFTASKTELAVARGDLNLPANAESVAVVRKNVVVLWVPSGLPPKGSKKPPAPKIKGIDDLAGHRVGVIGRTQANVTFLRVILTESGVNPDKVAVTQFGTDQIAEMARDPTIDAFMAVGPLDSKITTEAIAATAAARGEPKFLPIEVSEAIAKKHPLYESEEIAGSIFSASPARPEDKIETPDTDKDAALPAHAGAAAFIEGTERTFLERYSDYFWAAILVLSGLGSVGAWLRHSWKRNEREQYTLHRDSLLDLISKARQAETAEELATMQGEADGILREALDCYDDGAIEEGDLSVIGLALEQFHHAVADRRVSIGVSAADLPRRRAL